MAFLKYRGSAVPTVAWTVDAAANAALSNIDIDTNFYSLNVQKLDIAGGTVTGSLVVDGNLTVNGTTTTVNSTTISVDDKNIELGSVAVPTDVLADGGGITLLGTTNKTFNWVDATDAWTSSEHLAVAPGKTLRVSGSTSGVAIVTTAAAAGTPTLTLPTTTGTLALTSQLPTVNDASLTLSIGTAGATNTSVTIGTGTGFTANDVTNTTYDIKVGPALTALVTSMTGAGTGFLRKNGADTYEIDTNVYSLSSHGHYIGTTAVQGSSANQAVTGVTSITGGIGNTNLSLVTSDTATASTASGILTLSTGATAGATSASGVLTIKTGNSSTWSGALSIYTGTATGANNSGAVTISTGTPGATGASGAITIESGTGGSTSGGSGAVIMMSGDTTSGASGGVWIQSGDATTGTSGNVTVFPGDSNSASGSLLNIYGSTNISTTSGTGGFVNITGGASNSATTSAFGGHVYIVGGPASSAAAIAKTSGSVIIDGGGIGANGTRTFGTVYIGNRADSTTYGTTAIVVGHSANTTTINGTVKVPNVGTSGFVKLTTGGQLTQDTNTYSLSSHGHYIGTTAVQASSAAQALTGITSVTSSTTLTLNSTTTSAITLDSGTTGGVNIGTNANAKTVTIGNATGATSVVVNSGTAGVTFNQVAAGVFKVTASAAPTTDMVQFTNAGFANVTAGVNAVNVTYVGGAAAVEASAQRIDITPGTTTGGIWSALRIVPQLGPVTGVTLHGVKFENMTTGLGTENMIFAGTGWDQILSYNGTSIISGTGLVNASQLTGSVPSGSLTTSINIGTTAIALNRASAEQALTGITGISTTSTSALTLDSGTTGAVNIGTNANAKTVTIGNVTGATSVVLNAGSGGVKLPTVGTSGLVRLGAGGILSADTTAFLSGTVPIANGGTNITTYATGDILYASAANVLSKLAKGTDGQVLKLASGFPAWGTDNDTVYTHPTYTYSAPTADAVTTLASIPLISTLTQTNGHVTGGTMRKLVAGTNVTITPAADGNITIASTDTNTNYYPTAFAWTAGTTAGPTGSLTGSGMSAVSYAAIPAAAAAASGIVTTGTQSFAGVKTFTNTTNATSTITGAIISGGGIAAANDIWAGGNVTAYSDARIKTNIEKITGALDKVNQLNGYTFDRTDINTSRQTGVIAQEVLKVLPEAVLGTEETTYGVAYGNMVGLLIEAIKELRAEVAELRGMK